MTELERSEVLHRNPVTQQGFTMMPNAVLTARRLSSGARLLYGLLKMHAWQADNAYPGQDRLAGYLGVSTRQVRTYQAELERAGLITVEQRGLRQTNRYWIEDIPAAFLSDRNSTSDQDRNSTSDKEDSVVKKTQPKKTQLSSVATQQAPQAPSQAVTPKQDTVCGTPPLDPGFDFKGLWSAIEDHTGRKLLWNFATETQAVKRIVKAYPGVTFAELIAFLAYLETVFPWSQDPTKQATFSEGAKHFARWYTNGQPPTLRQKGRVTYERTYDDPDAINAEIQAAAAAARAARGNVPGDRAEPMPFRRRA